MIKFIFSPVRSEDELTLACSGDAVILNGNRFDFSGLNEGDTLPLWDESDPENPVRTNTAPGYEWIAGDVSRVDGVLVVPLILPHGPMAPEETRFPEPVTVTEDGPVELPTWGDAVPEGTYAVIDGVAMSLEHYAVWVAVQKGLLTEEDYELWKAAQGGEG